MSFLDKIKAWFNTSPGSGGGATGRRYVVDAGGLARSDGKAERLSPGMQIKILQRLSRFAEKESVPISVVFEGKELRAVSHGGEFQGINVYFASKPGSLEDTLLKMARSSGRGSQVTIITDNIRLERRVLDGGGQPMRLSSFRKALEGTPNGPPGNRSQGRRRGGRRRGGPPRERGQERGQERRQESEGDGPRSKDPVHDLIDVVE